MGHAVLAVDEATGRDTSVVSNGCGSMCVVPGGARFARTVASLARGGMRGKGSCVLPGHS